jgi:hypothetical protein
MLMLLLILLLLLLLLLMLLLMLILMIQRRGIWRLEGTATVDRGRDRMTLVFGVVVVRTARIIIRE